MRLYLCIMENTQNNNIHKNQIIPLTDNAENTIVLFLAPMLILTRKDFGVNYQSYDNKNVHHIRIPLLSYNFSMNPIILPIFFILTLPIVFYFIYKYKIKEIHARNHLSSLVAVVAKKLKSNLTVLSDFRGLYAEEGVILKRWKYGSVSFKIWKYIEKNICQNSDIVTTISRNLTQYISETYKIKNVFFIPAIVNTDKFYFSTKLRKVFREENNILEDEIVFLYVGSFGLWHDIPTFYKYIDKYLKKFHIYQYKVYILSGVNKNQYKELHDSFNTKILTVEPNLVNNYLCGADIGILPGTEKEGKEFDIMYKTMISSKLEEYLCTGLKVIVNEKIEEVNTLIKDDFNENNIIQKDEKRQQISIKYQRLFSSEKIKNIYEELFKGVRN